MSLFEQGDLSIVSDEKNAECRTLAICVWFTPAIEVVVLVHILLRAQRHEKHCSDKTTKKNKKKTTRHERFPD